MSVIKSTARLLLSNTYCLYLRGEVSVYVCVTMSVIKSTTCLLLSIHTVCTCEVGLAYMFVCQCLSLRVFDVWC